MNRWRLTAPAILVLEVAKPVSFIAGQGLLLCEPLLGFFTGDTRVADYAELLSDRSSVEHLIARLEQDKANVGDDGKGKD